MPLLKKLTVMAILGAIGALVGAVLGEMLFLGEATPSSEPRKICLLFDVSGSMGDRISRESGRSVSQLRALKDAASDFLVRQDLATDPIGLAVFSSNARVVSELSHDAAALRRSITGLLANGGTNLGRGIDVAGSVLLRETGERWILVFTDGKPETSSSLGETPEQAALSAARRVRDAGIRIVAIGTGLADSDLLVRVTGSPDNVIISDPRKLNDAFRRSEELINRQMLASTATARGFEASVLLAAAWVALIAIGTAVGLVIGQNRHLRRRAIGTREMAVILVGGVVAGLAAGAASQSLFYMLSATKESVAIGRIVSWAVLGCGIGFGIASFVPNLNRHRATIAGTVGGVFAGFCFLTLVPAVGDTFGRLLSAAILGLATGLMVVLVEATSRAAFVTVHWSEHESSSLSLGAQPILVGNSPEAHVLLADADSPSPIMARISLADGVVGLQDHTGATRALAVGEILTFGRIRIEVCGTAAKAAVPAAALPKTRDVPRKVTAARGGEPKWYDTAASGRRER